MATHKFIHGLASAVLLLGGSALVSISSSAETHADAPDTITVVAPRISEERAPTGQVSKVFTAEMSAFVSFADLDLTRVRDVQELEDRVNQAAAGLCKDLEAEMPFGQPSRQICQRRAFDGAMAQVREATQIAMVE
jgi:UrcA family protein